MTDHSALRTNPSLLGRLKRETLDQGAWAEFVRRYGQQIYRWCRNWRLQKADAEDVTQTVLARLTDKMRTFTYDPERSFRGYLKTLTHFAWCDFLAGRKRAGAATGDSAELAALETIEARDDLVEHLNKEFDQELVEDAMEQVRQRVEPHTWEAFLLTALEGLSGAVVAERLGMKVATVFKAKSKVQKMLQEVIARAEGGEES
jgi:RNA polymerase sigma-70 factor (ECF subfamily)